VTLYGDRWGGEEQARQHLRELMKLLWEGKREEHRRLLELKQLVDSPLEKLDDLLGYLEEN